MSKPLKPRRGTTAENNAFVGEAYEVTYDTDKNTLVCRDGLTAGGFPLATEGDVSGLESTLRALITEEDSSLESTLRALIAEELAKKLNVSGGELGGTIILKDGTTLFVRRNNDDGSIVIRGGTDGTSAQITISGKHHSSPGRVTLQAIAGDASNILLVDPDGTSTVDGKNLVRSVCGTIANGTGNVTLDGEQWGSSSPSTSRQTLSIPASGGTITASASGYISAYGTSSTVLGYITLYNQTTAFGMNNYTSMANGAIRLFVPVKKGDKVLVSYSSVTMNSLIMVKSVGGAM